jgi:hypothetical protein
MAGGARTLTIKFVGDSKNMTRSVKDIVSTLDDTESAGKRVASAMKQLSGDAETTFADARDAADKLSRALGEDMVNQIQAGGRSVDGYIADLQRFGLTFDDVRTDVDELADAIRKVETTKASIDGLKAPLKDVDTNLQQVRDSGDQSRSVLANMVGNSAQDLGALGGVAGTAGMAIGQLAEYATEGNINMSGLAKVAGPMAGVSVAVIGISWAMGKLKESSEDAKKEAELMLEVQKQLRDGKFEDAGAKLAESYGGLAAELDAMGVPQQEVLDFIIGASESMPTFNRLLEENKVHFDEGGVGLNDFGGKLNGLAGDVYDARDAFSEQEDQLVATDEATQQFTDALIDAARETGDTEIAIRDLDEAYKQLTGQFSDEAAWLSLQEDMQQFRADMTDSTLSANEKRLKMVELKQSLLEYSAEVGNIPAEKQTEILALIEDGKIAEAERLLSSLTRPRNVPINANIIAPGGRYIPGGSNVVGATGGIVTRPTMATIGEAGPEAVIPLDSTPGSFPLSSVGGLGGTTIINNWTVTVPSVVDKGAVGREIAEALLAYQQQAGPVFVTTRS